MFVTSIFSYIKEGKKILFVNTIKQDLKPNDFQNDFKNFSMKNDFKLNGNLE